MLALYGWWWSGKTSIMKDIYNNSNSVLSWFQKHFFEARRYEQDSDLIVSLFHFLFFSEKWLSLNETWDIDLSFMKKLWLFLGQATISIGNFSIGRIIPIFLAWQATSYGGEVSEWLVSALQGIDINNFFDEYDEKLKKHEEELKKELIMPSSAYLDESKLKKGFEDLLQSESNKHIIFIDDLDRCEAENIINLLSSLKNFFCYIPNCIFVVWIDKKAVVQWLNVKYGDYIKAEEYLEKIFCHSFTITDNINVEKLVFEYTKHHDNEDRSTVMITMFKKIGFTNPRHLKKLLNKINILEPILKSEVPLDDDFQYMIYVYIAYLHEFHQEKYKALIAKKSYGSLQQNVSVSKKDSTTWTEHTQEVLFDRGFEARMKYFVDYHKTNTVNNINVQTREVWSNKDYRTLQQKNWYHFWFLFGQHQWFIEYLYNHFVRNKKISYSKEYYPVLETKISGIVQFIDKYF